MKSLLCAMIMVTFAGCLETDTLTTDEVNVSTTEQGLSTCTTSCDRPTYNGIPVSCTSEFYCISAPEAAYCLQADGTYAAAYCATGPVCGDGICDTGESQTCPSDCGPVCGNGICERGELRSCPDDCGISCFINCPCLINCP